MKYAIPALAALVALVSGAILSALFWSWALDSDDLTSIASFLTGVFVLGPLTTFVFLQVEERIK